MATERAELLAEQIVRQATALGRDRRGNGSRWKYVAELGDERRHLLTETEHRTMSKATGGAGGFLVPQDMDAMVTSARRARGVIGAQARELVTAHGRTIAAPVAATHGTGTWTAENAAFETAVNT